MPQDLHCPYCGSGLDPVVPVRTEGATSGYGVLRCGCAEYPVIEGIPILQHILGLRSVIAYVRSGNTMRALLQAMHVFRVRWAHNARWRQALYYLNCQRLISTPSLTFQDAVRLVRRPRTFGDYLFQRYANPSFLADLRLLPAIGPTIERRRLESGAEPVRILDLACGAGHSSFAISQWFPEARLVSADQDFISLYLAKRFLAPRATFVCFDVEMSSPFPDRHFDVVHCLDAFHYFKSKQGIVADLSRVATSDALWLFPHLHNALCDNVTAGIPLAPEGYARCFSALNPTFMDEAELLRDVRRSVPLTGRRTELDALATAPVLTMVAGGATTDRSTSDIVSWIRTHAARLGTNPIYRGHWTGHRLSLSLRWPNAVLQHECLAAERLLPSQVEVSRDMLDRALNAGRGSDDSIADDLLSRFVLVPLAPRYCRHDLLSVARSV